MRLRTAVSIGMLVVAAQVVGGGLPQANAGAKVTSNVQTTEKRVQGMITAVAATSMTIAPMRGQTVSGKIDPKKTKILVDGKLSKTADLQITYTAKAELGLDDVWVTVSADSTP